MPNDLTEGWYTIRNFKSWTVIDLSATDGKTVSGWNSNGRKNQRWQLNKHDSNSWTFYNVALGYLKVDSNQENAPRVFSSTPSFWNIIPLNNSIMPDDIFQINAVPGLTLEMKDGNAYDGTPIQLSRNLYSLRQLWQFKKVNGPN